MSSSSVREKSLQLAESVARYHAGCLRVIGAQNVALRDVRTTKKAALCVDVGQLTEVEGVLSNGQQVIVAPEVPPGDASEEELAEYESCQVVWERLRELSAKAAVERHAKEVVYGGPLLIGYLNKARGRSMDPVLAPLFMQAVSLRTDSDGSVVVNSSDEPPRFNTVLWKDGIGADDVTQIVNLGIEAQADLAAGWDPARAAELLKAVASIWPGLEVGEPDQSLHPWPQMAPAGERPDRPGLALHDGGVLFLANRSSPYLLADLESIAGDPGSVVIPDSPLSVLLEPPSTENRPESRAPHVEEVVYPFPSNGAQRQVADALEKNDLVVVQGPPGNGKSLTIANLASHLVAQGKSVLVSSHKPQALTVVRDKLEESGQRFLFASLIGDGAAAKRVLQGQIADVKAFAAQADRASLSRQLWEIEERRAAKGERYRELREQFIGTAEPDQEDAALKWEDFGGLPTLPVTDKPIDTAKQPLAAAALRRLDEIVREHDNVWARLRGSAIADLKSIEEQRQTLGQFVDQQTARVVAGTDPAVKALVAAFHPVVDGQPSELAEARRASEEIRSSLVAVLGASEQREAADRLAESPDLLSDVEGGADSLEAAFAEARDLAPYRDDVSAEPVRRGQVVAQHAQLGSMLKRRAARRWLDEYAPGAVGVSEEQVGKWAAFWDSWSRVRTIADGLAGGLRAEIAERFDPDAVQGVLSSSRRAIDRAKAIREAREAARTTRVPLPIEEVLEAKAQGDLDDVVLRWERALSACEADQAGNALKELDSLAFLEGDAVKVDDLLDQGAYAEADEILDRLREIRAALPGFQERRSLLDGALDNLPGAAEEVESCGEELDAPPSWFGDIELSLAVHPSVVRFAEVSDERSTGDLAAELSELVDDIVDDAGRYLGARIQERILDGFRKPSFLSSLEGFRKAIGASAKRFERFEELKNSPDFDIDVLTDVFPCWIMRPEDACRVFPLRPDVFDVLIVDEASQCNPDQALPLFARASSVVIVGDDKQLSNEDLRRTLSATANKTLLQQAGLDTRDPAGYFDQTRNSLLELASRRQQASVLLNEHFRCRPELIAFSNARFYGNNLTVMRDRMDDRGLGSPLLVRQVSIDDPIPTGRGAKVNYSEAEALVEDLQRRIEDPRYDGMTFGVLSLFREQVEYIETLIERRIGTKEREQRRLICSTVDGFQGDERDVILYSWRYTAADHPAVFAFTNGGGGEQRINVALTRARHQAVHFVSVPIEEFPMSAANITGYLRHAVDPEVLLEQAEARVHREPEGRARRNLTEALADAGLENAENYVACGVNADLVASDVSSSKRAAVLVDAERDPHRPADTPERIDQQALLERAGWAVVRIPATEVLSSPEVSVRRVKEAVARGQVVPSSDLAEESRTLVTVDAAGLPVPEDLLDVDGEITPEDRADYNWEVPPVETRLASGEPVFMSDFEKDLFSELTQAGGADLKVVPQWPTRNKQIDLVLTDRRGGRLAVEADGAQHHQTPTGAFIPEDVERQALLEEAGWVFCRVEHSAFAKDPDSEVRKILEALAAQPENAGLAELVWGDGGVAEAMAVPADVAPAELPLDGTATSSTSDLVEAAHSTEPADEESETSRAADPTLERADGNQGGSAFDAGERGEAAEPAPVSAEANGDGGEAVLSFDDLPLGQVAQLVTGAVEALGEVPDHRLPDAFSKHVGVPLKSGERRTVVRFAWTAKGKKWLQLEDEVWRPGVGPGEVDEAWGIWTMSAIVDRARQLAVQDSDPFGPLLAEVYMGHRTPKLAMSLVGAAINRAKKADSK
jgi:very-short-patch-repair endonuclease